MRDGDWCGTVAIFKESTMRKILRTPMEVINDIRTVWELRRELGVKPIRTVEERTLYVRAITMPDMYTKCM
jgi:hypothetical protein